MEHYIDLTEIDKKYKDKCSLIKAGKCKNVNIFLENSRELKQLKKENEELKKTVDDLLHKPEIQDKIFWKIDNEALLGSKDAWIYKLKQTLAEIKKIAEAHTGHFPDGTIFARPEIEQILEKISEVEDVSSDS